MRIARALLCSLLALAAAPLSAGDEGVTLVLAGGGARGIAHVGAIAALEELQVPVIAIAGTSMGALVGGLYAVGMDASELRQVVDDMAWERAFEDSLAREDLPPRRKSEDYDYPSSISLAFRDGEISIPLGIVQGQQVRQMIKDLVEQAEHIRDFDQLPIPYRAVATDIETGEAYVFSGGSLVTAMRASMSLPALLAPVEHDQRLLVDGGLAMNIPVSVGRAMTGGRLVVVDIGTPLRNRDEIRSVVGVADQLLNFLTRKNSLEQLATLGDGDILVDPVLTGIGMLDFDQSALIYQQGYQATMAMRAELEPLALADEDWQRYLASREISREQPPRVDHIAIVNDSAIRDEVIAARIRQPLGRPLDREQLGEDIAAIYALDHWQIIDYEMLEDAALGQVLRINAQARTWGLDDLKLGISLVSDFEGSGDVNLGASYLWRGLTDLGGELYARTQLGDTILLGAEFYQPLDVYSRYFVVPNLSYRDYDANTLGPEFAPEAPVGNWRVRRLAAQLDVGSNLFDSTQLRLGLFRNKGEYKPDVEISGNLADDRYDEGGLMLSLRYDNMDDPFFPTRGGLVYGDYRLMRRDLGADHNFERWLALGQAALSLGSQRRSTLIFTGRLGQSIDARNEPQNYFQLGGLFNLSGVSQNLFSGRQLAFAMAQYQWRLSDDSVVFDMPAYVGASYEGGQLWSTRSEMSSDDLVTAGSLYLAMDSPIGPVYLAYGRTEESQHALYLSLGWPFLNNQLRMGR